MSNYEYKCYQSKGTPQKLFIFIHGYNGSPESIDYAVQEMVAKLENTLVCIPRAPHICEKDSHNLQWFSLFKNDPNMKFRNVLTPTPQIFDIFQKNGDMAAEVAAKLNTFIDEIQQKYNIDNAHTYLGGFSQGAMLTYYTSLTRSTPLAGCVLVAGIIPGMDELSHKIKSRPQMLLVHGEKDETVQYKTLPTTINWLLENGIDLRVHTHIELAHRIGTDETTQIARFINTGKR